MNVTGNGELEYQAKMKVEQQIRKKDVMLIDRKINNRMIGGTS